MDTAAILALVKKPAHTWTYEEECAAKDMLAATPEPLQDAHVRLLFTLGDAEEARLARQGATHADLDD